MRHLADLPFIEALPGGRSQPRPLSRQSWRRACLGFVGCNVALVLTLMLLAHVA